MRTTRREYMLAWLVLLAAVLIAHFIAKSCLAVHFGKDQGLVFRMSIFILSSAALFGYVCRSWLVGLSLGFGVGLVGQLCAFATLLLSSLLIKGDFSGWDIPLVWDQLIAASFLLLFGIIRRRWAVRCPP
jgi:hypothetical protein